MVHDPGGKHDWAVLPGGDRKRKARNARRNAPDQRGESDGAEAGQFGEPLDKQSDRETVEQTDSREQVNGQMSGQTSAHMSRLPDKCPDTCPQGERTTQMPPPDIAARPGYAPMWGDRLVLGQFRNVYLTRRELSDLRETFPNLADAYIERMSRYMHSSGRSYENHTDTLRQWIVKDTARPDRSGKAYRSAQNALPGYDHNYAVEEGESI